MRSSIDVKIEQCQNGTSGTTDCTGTPESTRTWTTGSLNSSHSLYREGDFVPFRVILTDLTPDAEYTLRIGYDAVEHDLHAYDYLGSVDGSKAPEQRILPCDGVAGTSGTHPCGTGSTPGPPDTLEIPIDTHTHFPSGRSQIPGEFSAWGAMLKSAAYVSPTPITVHTAGDVERVVDLTFTAEGHTVVLAWGGHIASSLDWGEGNTYVSTFSGAPFHMRLRTLNGHPTGNQDLSLHASALAPRPDPFTTHVTPPSVAVREPVTDTATLGGRAGVPPRGSVAFYICFNATTSPDCRTGGVLAGLPVAVSAHPSSSTGLASIEFLPRAPGHYCFRAEYTPAPGAPFSPAAHTNMTTECFTATTTPPPPPPPTISITKECLPTDDPGHFNLTINGSVAGTGANVPCGGTTGAVEVDPGPNTVGETAGSDTSLGDYETVIGGDCAPDGTIVVEEGEQARCTITNVRKTEPFALLTLNKICVPVGDSGLFNLTINQHTEADVPCGGRIGPLAVPVGPQQVGETAGAGTSLADYTSTIGGACATNGSITLKDGESAICTITNVRNASPPEPTATLEVKKICAPASDKHRFTLQLDRQLLPLMACGQSTGPMLVASGSHLVNEPAAGTNPSVYETVIGGDCAPDGTITLKANQHAVCTVTNTRKPPPSPPTPPTVCYTITARPGKVRAGRHSTIVAHVTAAGRPVHGAVVTLAGLGILKKRTSGPDGTAHFLVRPPRSGALVLSTERQFGCPEGAKSRVGVAAANSRRPPPVTG